MSLSSSLTVESRYYNWTCTTYHCEYLTADSQPTPKQLSSPHFLFLFTRTPLRLPTQFSLSHHCRANATLLQEGLRHTRSPLPARPKKGRRTSCKFVGPRTLVGVELAFSISLSMKKSGKRTNRTFPLLLFSIPEKEEVDHPPKQTTSFI